MKGIITFFFILMQSLSVASDTTQQNEFVCPDSCTYNNVGCICIQQEDTTIKDQGIQKSIFDWQAIIAIVAIISLIVSLLPYMRRVAIKGKVLSYCYSPNGSVQLENTYHSGILYYFKIALHCSNQNFYIKDIKIDMKYKSVGIQHAIVFYAHDFHLVFDDGKRRKLAIDSFDNYLPFETVLKKDVARGYHVTFIVPKMYAFEEYEEMIITFIPFSGKERTIVLKAKDRKKDLMLFDDSIWEIE